MRRVRDLVVGRVFAIVAAASPASAQSVAEFYKGK